MGLCRPAVSAALKQRKTTWNEQQRWRGRQRVTKERRPYSRPADEHNVLGSCTEIFSRTARTSSLCRRAAERGLRRVGVELLIQSPALRRVGHTSLGIPLSRRPVAGAGQAAGTKRERQLWHVVRSFFHLVGIIATPHSAGALLSLVVMTWPSDWRCMSRGDSGHSPCTPHFGSRGGVSGSTSFWPTPVVF